MSRLLPSERYSAAGRSLHWLVALLVFALLAMGKFFEVEPDEEGSLFAWHSALGLLVLALMVVRLFWRTTHEVPALPASTPAVMITITKLVHAAFYLLLFILPLTGWLLASMEGETISFPGLFEVPGLPTAGLGDESEDFIEEVHELAGNVLLVLAGVHVLAALKHQFIDRDNVLRSMLPG
jgi:cytochrome b561